MLHQMLTKDAIVRYESIQRAEITQLMYDLLVDQEVCLPALFITSYTNFQSSTSMTTHSDLRTPLRPLSYLASALRAARAPPLLRLAH